MSKSKYLALIKSVLSLPLVVAGCSAQDGTPGGQQAALVTKPYPFDGAAGVSTASDLAWEAPVDRGYIYDVHFGADKNPPFICSQTRIVYDPGRLLPATAYYWRVDAKKDGKTVTGKVYRFTTGSGGAQPNKLDEKGDVLLSGQFDASSGNWLPIYLSGSEGGSFSIMDGKLNLRAVGPDVIYGVYNKAPVSGHFYAEVDYDSDNFAGLALIREKDGRPDPNNYVMMSVSEKDGKVFVTANDKQDGQSDVLGKKHNVPEDHYQVQLDGTKFSVPFVGTAKHFRIMHEALWGSFRYLFKVQSEIKGQHTVGWMETTGSPDWSEDPVTQKFFVALLVRSGHSSEASVSLNNFLAVRKPTEDRDDTNTGFAVTRREYNWSGFSDEAVVVTFGNEFPYADEDRKFVFWRGAIDTPHWHINNQAIYFNEFIETWEDLSTMPTVLCFEPMSDRMCRFTKVDILEDNAVRKVVRWTYNIVDPDYRYPGDPVGVQAPEAVETYTFYRDGTITRKQRYTPKLDSGIHQQGNELQESIVGAGSKTWYPDLMARPASTLCNLKGGVLHLLPDSGPDDISDWDQFITSVNFYDGVAPFVSYSSADDTPDVFPYPVKVRIPISSNKKAQRVGAAHWPVQKAPYENPMWGRAYLTGEAKSWSFSKASNWQGDGPDEGDLQFKWHYKVDERGRKYREWVSLVGMADVGDLDTPEKFVRSWLYPGEVSTDGPDFVFLGNNRQDKTLVFGSNGLTGVLKFSLTPKTATINPAIEVKDWAGDPTFTVKIDGAAQRPGADYVADREGGSLLLWFNKTFTSAANFEIIRDTTI